jgi:hypothetical protein
VSQNYTANQAVEYNGSSYVCHTDTVSNEVPTDTNYWDVLAAQGDPLPPTVTEVSATAETTTTSTTYVLMNGMTITPAAGNYMVWFSTAISNNSNLENDYIAIYKGGTIIQSTERRTLLAKNERVPFSTQGKVTVNGSEAIEIRWKVTNGTGSALERILNIMEIN